MSTGPPETKPSLNCIDHPTTQNLEQYSEMYPGDEASVSMADLRKASYTTLKDKVSLAVKKPWSGLEFWTSQLTVV